MWITVLDQSFPMQHVNQIRRGQQEKGPNPLNMKNVWKLENNKII